MNIKEKCFAFLENVPDDELKELVYSCEKPFVEPHHIMRKMIKYVFNNEDTFALKVLEIYPYLAQECWERMNSYKNM